MSTVNSNAEGNHAGLVAVLVFLVVLWVLRALFSAADQTK